MSDPEPQNAHTFPRSRGPLDLPSLPPPARRYVLLAAGVVAAVYLLSVNNAWWPTPDSALYQGLAKSMAQGRGYVFNGQAHTTVTPGLPLILAGLRLAFGEGYWAANLFMTLCGLGGLLLAWMSLRRLTDEWTALLTVVACAASYECFHDSHAILTDAPFFLLFWAVTYASLRLLGGGWAWLAPTAVLAALALAVRAPGIIVLGPLAAALLVQRAGAAAGWARRLAAAAVVLVVPLLTAGGCTCWPGPIATSRRSMSTRRTFASTS